MLKYGIIIVWIFIAVAWSCNSKEKSSIDKKTMASILAELQLNESMVSRMNFGSIDSSKTVFNFLEKKIYKKYNVDSASYARNYRIYAKEKAELLDIYSRAEKILDKEKAATSEGNLKQ